MPDPAADPTQPPTSRPVLVFDGDCRFCRLWIERWKEATGDGVEYLAQQEPECRQRFPQLDPAALEQAVHFVEPDGRTSRGAEAVLRALQAAPRLRAPARAALRRPAFMALAEAAYGVVARNRMVFSRITRWLWGDSARQPTWHVARELFLVGLAVIHLLAFVSLGSQIDGLIGSRGILPAAEFMHEVGSRLDQANIGWDRYRLLPTLAWFGAGDAALHGLVLAGIALALVALSGFARAPAFLGLWLTYLSFSVAGRDFFSFQWDTLLLETSLLAVFLAPWCLGRARARAQPPSRLARGLLVWLLFRLMLESGLVKLLSGDANWRQLAALEFHYWTQPLPGPAAWFVHQAPAWFHRAACAAMFAIELALPWFVVAPRRPRLLAFAGFALLQVAILATGNYGFFNLLALLLSLLLVDDATWRRWLRRPSSSPASCSASSASATDSSPDPASPTNSPRPVGERWRRRVLPLLATVCLLAGSAPLLGLLAPRLGLDRPGRLLLQALAPLRSLNPYGLFAVMTTTRPEILVEGSDDLVTWKTYEFRHKPGAPARRPGQVAPHMPRLDWQMWFAALDDVRQNPWFVPFALRLLEGSPAVLELMQENPFPGAPPKYLRARLDHYRYTTAAERAATGAWWIREERGFYCPPISRPRDPN